MPKMVTIPEEFFEFARASDPVTRWHEGLYLLCRKLPDHTSPDVVAAKVSLIRRSLSTAADRGRDRTIEGREYHDDLIAPVLVQSRLDELLDSLRAFSALDETSLGPVVRSHGYLAAVKRQATGTETRSLAARYLHFHLPRLVPPFNNQAALGLSKLCRNRMYRVDVPRGGDPSYARFCARLLHVQQELETTYGERLTPRQMDRLLHAFAEGGVTADA
jgi:hypothetical protein